MIKDEMTNTINNNSELLKGRSFSIHIQGCRTNQYEGEAIAAALEGCGAVRNDEAPEIVVIVSCTITAVADRKCRKLIRRVRREKPKAVIAACGCYAQKLTAEEQKELSLDLVIGNRLKHELPALLAERLAGGAALSHINPEIRADLSWDILTLDRPRLHTRAFLKVQDGCSHYCSYCIVPYVRGLPVSRPVDEAVEEARRITDSGCPEIVLTGVHLGLYSELPQLVRRIGALPGIRRLRFGSLEPFAVTEELLRELADCEAFCRHLHLPLQSGSDRVLEAMHRGYNAQAFASVAERARRLLGEELHISTDLMVGFPTEDQQAFKESLAFVKEQAFGKVHVFPYSPREGTEAAKLTPLAEQVLKERTAEALDSAASLHRAFCSRYIGKSCELLTESSQNGCTHGLTRNYIKITAQGTQEINKEITVIPAQYFKEGLITEAISANMPDFGDVSVI